MISADQELYDGLYYYSQSKLNFDTYDQLPRNDASYPFVHFGTTEDDSGAIKNANSGELTQAINIWGTEDMRFEITKMMDQLTLEKLSTDHCVFYLKQRQKQILPDSSVPNTRLFHGILTLVFDWTQTRKE